jgi:hypothetical protein
MKPGFLYLTTNLITISIEPHLRSASQPAKKSIDYIQSREYRERQPAYGLQSSNYIEPALLSQNNRTNMPGEESKYEVIGKIGKLMSASRPMGLLSSKNLIARSCS